MDYKALCSTKCTRATIVDGSEVTDNAERDAVLRVVGNWLVLDFGGGDMYKVSRYAYCVDCDATLQRDAMLFLRDWSESKRASRIDGDVYYLVVESARTAPEVQADYAEQGAQGAQEEPKLSREPAPPVDYSCGLVDPSIAGEQPQ